MEHHFDWVPSHVFDLNLVIICTHHWRNLVDERERLIKIQFVEDQVKVKMKGPN
jgi:hypothetical protein